MILILKFGKKFEIKRIKDTFDKLEWYNSHGYRPFLPNCKNDLKEIERFVNTEFKKEEYEKAGEDLMTHFSKIKDEFKIKLESIINKKIPKEIELIVTKYGVGGSYSLPNKVIINIQGNHISKPLTEVLKHEIIHLLLEEEVIEKRLSHKQKEELIRKIESLSRY
jgi:hypothetical protein